MALWPVEVRRTARGQGDKAKVSRADGRIAGSPIKCTRDRPRLYRRKHTGPAAADPLTVRFRSVDRQVPI